MVSIGFILTSLMVVAIPGTGVIYTISTSLTGSRKASLTAALGCTLGIIPHLTAGILGISAILHTGSQLFQIVKFAGVIYLIYLGIDLIRSKNKIEFDEKKQTENGFKIIGKAILLNLLNPKLTIFFLSFLPQFISDSKQNYTTQMIFLSLIFMLMTLIIFSLYGLLANFFKLLILRSKKLTRRIQQAFGIILIGFAAKLALDRD